MKERYFRLIRNDDVLDPGENYIYLEWLMMDPDVLNQMPTNLFREGFHIDTYGDQVELCSEVYALAIEIDEETARTMKKEHSHSQVDESMVFRYYMDD